MEPTCGCAHLAEKRSTGMRNDQTVAISTGKLHIATLIKMLNEQEEGVDLLKLDLIRTHGNCS
jgi:hypothetical protein